jgi:hypothetical protein
MARHDLVCACTFALVACSTQNGDRPPTRFQTAVSAFEEVCARPSTPQGVARAMQNLGWSHLADSDVPDPIVGNGTTHWSKVVASPDGDLVVAVGELSGTSFCRVYAARGSWSAAREGLERHRAWGEALGQPDFARRTAEHVTVGWHRMSGGEWRAVHLTGQDQSKGSGTDTALLLEMTRAAS